MTILTTTRHLTICAEEKEIEQGNRHYFVINNGASGAVYDASNDFEVVSELSPKGARGRLDQSRILEYHGVLDSADEAWDKKYAAIKATIPVKQGAALSDKLSDMLVQVLADQSAEAIFDATMPMVRQKIVEEFGLVPQVHEIKTPTETRKITGVTHEKFDTVLNLINANIPVFLTGAAGTGKNVLCKQVAEALNLDFFFTNAVTQEYKLTGFIDANGTYHQTQFYKAFKYGGMFFLDEMDGSIPEVLIMLNAAIANGYFDFPQGKVEAHENFRVIAAGNTFGTGADLEYTGRYQLDAASLDRFALVRIDYSPKIEEAMAGGDEELCRFIRCFREATENAGIRHLATYRSIDRIHKLADTMELAEVLRIALLKNLQKDDLNIICSNMDMVGNRYYNAMVEANV